MDGAKTPSPLVPVIPLQFAEAAQHSLSIRRGVDEDDVVPRRGGVLGRLNTVTPRPLRTIKGRPG